MNKKIGVSKIVINIGDKEASLTVEQAKELRDALTALLGGEKVIERVIERDRWHTAPYIYPRYWGVTVGDQPPYGTITGTHGNTSGAYTITLNGNGGELLPA